ncbi:Hypothetical predicted protein [Lecanosticta acicola]|uniref:Uncharacterized protein n=1 Tax=Lecanosticta acicola TaxID=111012 RepID=A0AAI8Z956_9PEZI|nr:Hypothetical predicted protein [Lecanosticta acicola]
MLANPTRATTVYFWNNRFVFTINTMDATKHITFCVQGKFGGSWWSKRKAGDNPLHVNIIFDTLNRVNMMNWPKADSHGKAGRFRRYNSEGCQCDGDAVDAVAAAFDIIWKLGRKLAWETLGPIWEIHLAAMKRRSAATWQWD